MKKALFTVAIIAGLSFLNSCKKHDFFNTGSNHPHGDYSSAAVATDWYKMQLRILLERNSALNGVYFGYIGIGLYESVRYQGRHFNSLSDKLYQMPVMPQKENTDNYNWDVSANAALAAMVRAYYAGLTPENLASIDSLENAYNQKLKPACGEDAFLRSQTFGRNTATAVYNWSLTDNFNPSNVGYVPPVFPGSWVPTPPAFANGVQPYISASRPFLAENATAIAGPFPTPYDETPNSPFYNVMKKVYDVSKALTTEQKNIALYYVDQGNGLGYTPPGHDFSILTQVLEQRHVGLLEAAEAYAKAGITERDATLICFRSKYKYNTVRPVTYIRKFIDTAWLPFIVTPPHPEYPAAHAYITGAVMQAAAKVLGDHVSFTDHSYDFRGFSSRSHVSLFSAGEEAGISRLYGGIHLLPSINIGLELAKDLGNKVGNIKLHD